MAGKRCLDIGTMDGFWAFELERRGAAEVIATDLPGSRGAETFAAAKELLRSRVEYRHANVYDLDPAEHGLFDVVFFGFVLQMLADPLRGLEAIRSVCRGHLIVLDTISRPLDVLPSPLARLDARRNAREWFVFNRRGLRKALELAGWEVEVVTPVLRDHAGPGVPPLSPLTRAKFAVGLLGRSAAVRARPR